MLTHARFKGVMFDLSMKQLVIIFLLVSLPFSASSNCESLAYGSKRVEGIIEIENKNKEDFFNISIPKEFDGLKFFYAVLEKGCSKDGYSSYSIPLQTEERDGFIKAYVKMPRNKAKNWKVHVGYVVGQTKDIIIFDGPAYESWAPLQHNKVKNENASGAGTDAQKDARPF